MTPKEESEVLDKFIELTTQHTLAVFTMLGLESHIESTIVNQTDGVNYKFTFEKIGKRLPNKFHVMNIGEFEISKHPPIPNTNQKNLIWLENSEGEGPTIDLDELFKEKM